MREMIKAAAIKFARNVHSLTEQDLSEIKVEYRDNRLLLNLCLQFGPGLNIVDIEVIAGSESTDTNFMSLGFDEIEALSNEALVAKVEMEIENAILNHPGISLKTETSFDGSLRSLCFSASQNTIVGDAANPTSDSEVQHLLEKTAELKRMIADLALENHVLKASVSVEGHNPGDPGGESQS